MSQYKLAYFNSKYRGEVTRILFHLGGIEYDDWRISYEEWPQRKLEMPCKQVPVLYINGEPLTQSRAIARYVAKKTGYYGNTDLECARIDAVMDTCSDFRSINAWFSAQDLEEKESWIKLLKEQEACQVFTDLEALLKQNNGGNGFFVGEKITVADLFVVCELELVLVFAEDMLDNYPKLSALYARVRANERVAEWIKKRPKTKY